MMARAWQTHSMRGALAAAVLCATALPADADELAARQRAVSNRLALVKVLLNSTPSITRIEQGPSEEAKALLGAARVAYHEATGLCENPGDLERCEKKLAEALETIKAAGRASNDPQKMAAQYEAQYRQLRERVHGFRRTLSQVSPQPSGDFSGREVNALLRDADALAAERRFKEASALLAQAGELIERELSRALDKKTVTYSLTFASPAEEYAYELERYRSLEMLIELMLNERPELMGTRATIRDLLANGGQMKTEAAALEQRGEIRAALTRLEEATAVLTRALRLTGVPVQ